VVLRVRSRADDAVSPGMLVTIAIPPEAVWIIPEDDPQSPSPLGGEG
jgi:hypothetical protein